MFEMFCVENFFVAQALVPVPILYLVLTQRSFVAQEPGPRQTRSLHLLGLRHSCLCGFSLVFQFTRIMWHSRPRLCILAFIFLFRFLIMRPMSSFFSSLYKSCHPVYNNEGEVKRIRENGVTEESRRIPTLFRASKPHQGVLSKDLHLICAHLRKSAANVFACDCGAQAPSPCADKEYALLLLRARHRPSIECDQCTEIRGQLHPPRKMQNALYYLAHNRTAPSSAAENSPARSETSNASEDKCRVSWKRPHSLLPQAGAQQSGAT